MIGSAELDWQGRQLVEWMDDYISYSFEYNADGIRTVKIMSEPIVGYESRKEYMLDGSRIIGETMYETFDVSQGFTEQYTFIYLYDELGAPIGLKYRTPSYANGVFDCYFFEKNLQGDIVAIYNESGAKVGTYTYDAWGNCTVNPTSGYNFILSNNPFRYRGYYYDTETGFYYLQSRYYNPQWGRFISEDKYISTGDDFMGCNMFIYCGNNPVMRIDYYGCSWNSFWKGLKLFGEECARVAAAVACVATAVLVVGAAIGGTIVSGGTGAIAIPAAIAVAAECIAVASIAVAVTGVVATSVATLAMGEGSSNSRHIGDSTYNDGKRRVDYEVYGEGNGKGNVHLQIGKDKYKLFELNNHTSNRLPIEKSIQKILDKYPQIVKSVDKAIKYVISLGG